jgi:hypothetical protein
VKFPKPTIRSFLPGKRANQFALLSALSLGAWGSFADSPTNQTVALAWTWGPNIADMGGLSTNDYVTNVSFKIFTTTDATAPTNLWTIATNVPATSFWTNDANVLQYTVTLACDTATRFYAAVTSDARADSNFSQVAAYLAAPFPGLMQPPTRGR